MPRTSDAHGRPRSRPISVQRVVLVVAAVSLVLFWLAMIADDAAISPIAFLDLPAGLLVLLAVVHVVSAPVGWIVGLVRLQRVGRGRAVLFGVIAVPITALMTLGVMLSDAIVWRGDLYDWMGRMLLALAGPVVLAAFLGMALASAPNADPPDG
jgi:hypothetical protein